MAEIQKYYSWLPTHEQGLLLQAAFQKGQPASKKLDEWSETANIYALDDGSRRLLPLLYHNLKCEGITHPVNPHAKKVYIETWAKNQVLFAKIIPILQLFQNAQIETILLKGAAFTIKYYRDFGLRPMTDIDILVPTSRAEEAINYLQKSGWEPGVKSPKRYIPIYLKMHHALHFTDSLNNDFDLHWHVLSECLAPDADEDFWDGARPFEINGVQTLCMNPTDDLFHVCVHGVGWNRMPPIRWVADALTILNSGESFDWDRLVALAKKRSMTLILKDALVYLIDNFEAPVSTKCIEQLDRIQVSPTEVKEYKSRINHPFWYFSAPTLWAFYPRIARDTGMPAGILGFIKYMQYIKELDHVWQLPISVLLNILRRFIGKR